MTHCTEEQLVLHMYGEAQDREVDAHLSSCADCAAQLEALHRDLAILDSTEVPEPPAFYEAQLWNRLQWRMKAERPVRRWIPLSVAAGFLVAVIAGTAVWRMRPTPPPIQPTPVAANTAAEAPRAERVLLLVVSEHYGRSARLLLEVANTTPGEKIDLGAEQESAQDLVETNRLYRQTASQSGQREIALLLEELEPILLELARSPAQPAAGDLRALQRRIESKGLVFKLRVLSGESEAPIEVRNEI
jgi:hypothetical protein